MSLKLISMVILAGLVVMFIVQNVATVEIQFLIWSTQLPRSVLMLVMLTAGIIIGWSLRSLQGRKRRG